jgi:hypothetical protein
VRRDVPSKLITMQWESPADHQTGRTHFEAAPSPWGNTREHAT